VGNLVSSFTWEVEWSPQYRPSMIIGICSLLVAISLAFVIRTMLARENRRMDHEDSDQLSLNEAKRGRVEQATKRRELRLQRLWRSNVDSATCYRTKILSCFGTCKVVVQSRVHIILYV